MNFNAAINPFTAPSFKEGCKLASIRDNRNVGKSWLKDREMARNLENTNSQLRKVGREVSKARRRIVGGFVPTETELMFPFKIYAIENVSATPVQAALFSALGFNINELTFQIRGGFVGGRCYINNPSDAGLQSISGFSPSGNFEVNLQVDGTDSPPDEGGNIPAFNFWQPFANTGTCTILDNVNPTLLAGISAGSPIGTQPIFSNQIALNQNPIDNDSWTWAAAFWLEMVDDPLNGFYANLMGQMFGDIGSGRTLTPIPNGPNIIPIGFLNVSQIDKAGSFETQVTNFVTANVMNRFAPASTRMAGRWNELYAALPAGITTLYWYPGDMVVDDSTPIVDASGFTYYKIWKLIKTPYAGYLVANTPSVTDWQEFGIST